MEREKRRDIDTDLDAEGQAGGKFKAKDLSISVELEWDKRPQVTDRDLQESLKYRKEKWKGYRWEAPSTINKVRKFTPFKSITTFIQSNCGLSTPQGFQENISEF